MWIEKTKTGYAYRETYVDPLTGKRKKASVTMPSRSRTAQKAAYESLQALINSKLHPAKDITLGDMLESYIESKRGFVKPGTVRNYEITQRHILECWPADTLVSKLTAGELQKALDAAALSRSVDYARRVRILLHSAYMQAYASGRLDSVDAINRTAINRPQQDVTKVKRKQEHFLSRQELGTVLAMVRKINPALADVFEFQSLTGLRFGELAALREEDYDGKAVDVNATLCWAKRGLSPYRGSPKNVYSIRKVILDKRCRTIVDRFILHNKQQRAWFHRKQEANYIFTTSTGSPLDIAYANRILRSLCYEKPLSTHIFRHTHISMLAEKGVPLKAIMARVGHNDPATTMAIYTHVTENMEAEVLKALNSIK